MILTYDAVLAFRDPHGQWGHMGLGTVICVINTVLIWAYTLSCHSCRHIVGGRLKHFSKHPVRYWLWERVSKLNARHMQLAWVSLIWVAVTDFYVFLVATGTIADPQVLLKHRNRSCMSRELCMTRARTATVRRRRGRRRRCRAARRDRGPRAGRCVPRSSASRCSARRTR